jgi:hypothetical protein
MTIAPDSLIVLAALIVVVGLKLALYTAERWPIRLNAPKTRDDNRQPVP